MERVILNMPGPSAVGRDFIIESVIGNVVPLKQDLGISTLDVSVLPKVTTRESRTVELTKKPISEEQFDILLKEGGITAPYVLESNGKRYGYEVTAFDIPGDILIADASVYQTPALKDKLGDSLYSIAVVSSREYRERNIRERIASGKSSESEEEVAARLNLGDAHVALLMLMAGKSYQGLIDDEFAANVDAFMKKDDSKAELIRNFCNSQNVVDLLANLRNSPRILIEDVLVRDQRYHVPKGEPVVGSLLWNEVVQDLRRAVDRSNHK